MKTLIANPVARRGHAPLWCALALLAAGCSSTTGTVGSNGGSGGGIGLGSGGSANDTVSPDFAIAYIQRALPPSTGANARTLEDDLRIQRVWNGPADVWVRERASPSATAKNITHAITGGNWDVRDLDVSFDGTKLIFSMRAPLIPNAKQSQQPTWMIFEYDHAAGTLRQVISDPIAASLGHDVAPHYLPDGRIVFASTRQHEAKAVLIDEGKEQFAAGIEGDRELPAFVLHVMNADGSGIRQISFNTGHDLDPSVLNDGRILFTRWDIDTDAGMQLYALTPDGADLQLLYGRNSHTAACRSPPAPCAPAQFTQARTRPDGRIVALLLPFAGTDFGGDITLIDSANFVENLQSVLGAKIAAGTTGQSRLVVNDVSTVGAAAGAPAPPSPGGRFASVYPLWDGTNRLLVSWSLCRLLDQTVIVPCTTGNLAKPGLLPAPSVYSIWIYDIRNNTQLPIVAPVEGLMYTDAVALAPRLPTPTPIPDGGPSATGSYTFALAAEGVGILNIRSVYDFDGADAAPGGIAAVSDPTRRLPNPLRPRFVRIEKAVSLPDNEVLKELPGYAFGPAGSFMREMIGYAAIEPDGSARVKVPANIPFQISVLDVNGRRLDEVYPRHRAWLQIRTGETVTCNGCHVQTAGTDVSPPDSHGRRGLFTMVNTGASSQGFPNTALMVPNASGTMVPAMQPPASGESMAEYRARMQLTCLDAACAAPPSVDLVFTDVWTKVGVGTADPPFSWTNAQLATPPPVRAACASTWQGNCRVVIHYPTHIAPLWTTVRSTITAVDPLTKLRYTTCIGCHSPADAAGTKRVSAGQLDLSSTAASMNPCVQEQYTSFCQLLFPHPKLDPVTMQPIVVPGPIDPVTGLPTQVVVQQAPPMNGAGANASATFFGKFGTGASHAGWLSGAELKLLAEWLDLGAQYYNDPFAIPAAN